MHPSVPGAVGCFNETMSHTLIGSDYAKTSKGQGDTCPRMSRMSWYLRSCTCHDGPQNSCSLHCPHTAALHASTCARAQGHMPRHCTTQHRITSHGITSHHIDGCACRAACAGVRRLTRRWPRSTTALPCMPRQKALPPVTILGPG